MIKIVILFTALSVVTIPAQAQTKAFHALQPGEKVPDLTLSMLNGKQSRVKLSNFRGRLVILDFWSSWCTACLAAFPKLEELQKHFKDSLYILPVGFDNFGTSSIKTFISKRKGTDRELKFPTAVVAENDKRLDKLFPHSGLPFEVWIDKTGKFITATDQFSVNEENIHKLIAGQKVYLPNYMQNGSFNPQVPLLLNGNGGNENDFEFRSVLTKYNPSVSLSAVTMHNDQYTRLATGNETSIDLLKFAVAGAMDSGKTGYNFGRDWLNKITVLASDRADLKNAYLVEGIFSQSADSIEKFKQQNFFNYDLVLPPQFSLKEACTIMFNEVQQLFKVRAVVEKRKINCLDLIITNSDSVPNLNAKSMGAINGFDDDDLHYHVADVPMAQFCDYLNLFIKKLPVIINHTGIKFPVSINIVFDKNETLQSLNAKLNRYGLMLVSAEENVSVLVIY